MIVHCKQLMGGALKLLDKQIFFIFKLMNSQFTAESFYFLNVFYMLQANGIKIGPQHSPTSPSMPGAGGGGKQQGGGCC